MLDFYRLVVAAHDGLHERTASLHINVVKSPMHGNPSFRFSYPQYESRVVENSDATKAPLLVLSTVGTRLQEPIHFKLLNEEAKFVVGETSGALTVRPGTVFDREQQANYRLVVNAIALATDRVASTLIDVTIEDVNDNAPTFVDTPYHCVVPIESNKGEQVQRVRAEDPDDGANGRVLYYLRDLHKGVFDIDSKTGNITLRKRLPSHMTQYTITVVAKDEGNPPMYSEVQVPVKVVTRTMPSFQKQFYSAHVKENHLPSEPVLTLIAQSPGGKPLIYDITEGHHKEDFRLDYQAGECTWMSTCIRCPNPVSLGKTLVLPIIHLKGVQRGDAIFVLTVLYIYPFVFKSAFPFITVILCLFSWKIRITSKICPLMIHRIDESREPCSMIRRRECFALSLHAKFLSFSFFVCSRSKHS